MRRPNRSCTRAFAFAAAAVVSPSLAHAQRELDAFLAAARAGTAVYVDRAAAVAAGYRPVGPESPTMGQHWLHMGLLFSGVVDPSRPQILSYATIDGRPVLVGVAYALPAEAELPAGPAPAVAWHVHDGSIIAEALQPDHDAHAAMLRPAHQRRGVAVLHAWIYVPNPAGVFGSDNWNLPFVRAGIIPPAAPPLRDAARAVALAADSGAFFAAQVGATPQVTAALALGADSVRQWLVRRGTENPHATLTPAEIVWLARVWERVAARRR